MRRSVPKTATVLLWPVLLWQCTYAQAYDGTTPLNQLVIPYDKIPYKVDHGAYGRGPQTGYNICNSTTAGQSSMCQTAFINSLEDFCLFSMDSLKSVGVGEGEAVAWCTQPTHGTRVIPPGAIKGAQFLRTPSYVQVTGLIDNTAVDIPADDAGGEMDSAGADNRGNPVGGLMYTTAFGGNLPVQAQHWTIFMGGNQFCAKACPLGMGNAPQQCEHIYDTQGCQFNMPAAGYSNPDVFESCLANDQQPVGQNPGGIQAPASSSCSRSSASALPAAFNGAANPSSSASLASASAASASAASASISRTASAVSGSASVSPTPSGAASTLALPLPFALLRLLRLFGA